MLVVFIEDLTLSKESPNSFYYEGFGKAGAEIAKRKPYEFDPPLPNAQHHVRVMILRRASHNKRLLLLVLYIFIVNITIVFVHLMVLLFARYSCYWSPINPKTPKHRHCGLDPQSPAEKRIIQGIAARRPQ